MNEIEIIVEANKYDEREKQGKQYSKFMNAKLVVLGKDLLKAGFPPHLVKGIKDYIIEITKDTRTELLEGLWDSANRRALEMNPDTELQTIIDNYQLPINQNSLIQEIVDRTQKALNELY